MSRLSRRESREIVFFCLPVLVFRVRGDELLVSINGKPDPRGYRFLSDNAIEVTDNTPSKYRSKPLVYVIEARIRWGILEFSTIGKVWGMRRIGD